MKRLLLTLLAAAALPGAALAHVVIQPGAAPPGQVAETQVIVGHGCSGQPTTAVTITIPETVPMVHVMPTAGWTSKTTETGDRVSAITWTADDGKGVATPQTFVVHMMMPKTPGRIFLPAVQSCGATTVQWNDQALDSKPAPTHPAPSINVGGPATAAMPPMDHAHMEEHAH